MKGQTTNDLTFVGPPECAKGAKTKSSVLNGVMVTDIQNGKEIPHHDKLKRINGCVGHCCREELLCANGAWPDEITTKPEEPSLVSDAKPMTLDVPTESLKNPLTTSEEPCCSAFESPCYDSRTHPKSYHLPNGLNDGVMVQELVNRVQEMQLSASCAAAVNPAALRLRGWECPQDIRLVGYESERQMPDVMRLIQRDLSEPYSVYTYRYFIHNWPHLCFLALDEVDNCVGAVVCKLDMHKKSIRRGYIAMLAVDEQYRKKRIGSSLVLKAIHAMIADDADEVVLETEVTNRPALQLYENLGFVRDKRLFRYYLNGVDALRLKLWLR